MTIDYFPDNRLIQKYQNSAGVCPCLILLICINISTSAAPRNPAIV